jgi:hypothetical protein
VVVRTLWREPGTAAGATPAPARGHESTS